MDGASGGAADGSIAMKDGAEFENSGTFNADSWDPACGYGYGGTSFENAGGAASSITNTGTFQSDAEGSAINLEVGFTNGGTVSGAGSSSLAFHAGGGGTGGTWSAASGATLTFASGSFAFTEGTWSGLGTIKVAGGSVTATSLLGSSSHVSLCGGTLSVPEGSTTLGSWVDVEWRHVECRWAVWKRRGRSRRVARRRSAGLGSSWWAPKGPRR